MIYEITKDTNYDQDMTPETLISSVEAMKQKARKGDKAASAGRKRAQKTYCW